MKLTPEQKAFIEYGKAIATLKYRIERIRYRPNVVQEGIPGTFAPVPRRPEGRISTVLRYRRRPPEAGRMPGVGASYAKEMLEL